MIHIHRIGVAAKRAADAVLPFGMHARCEAHRGRSIETMSETVSIRLAVSYGGIHETAWQPIPDDPTREQEETLIRWAGDTAKSLAHAILMRLNPVEGRPAPPATPRVT